MKIKAAALFLLYLFLCKRYNKHKIIKGRGAMNTEKSILIRTDGNQDIAAGHLMRCLSIAQALHEKKVPVFFATADETSAGLLRTFFGSGEDYPIFILHSDYRKPDSETDSLISLFSQFHIGCLLVDSYFVTHSYLETLSEVTKTAYIDDLYSFDYPVDLLINYDAVIPENFYQQARRRLLGLSYTPLRKQFSRLQPTVRPEVKEILISTGGTDPCHAAESLLSQLIDSEESRDWCFHVLAGPMHSDRKSLEQMALSHPGLRLYEHVAQMAELMQRCDLAVSAAGTTLFELCAAGTPAVSFTMADNQFTTAVQMEAGAGIPCAGDVRIAKDFTSGLCRILYGLASDYEKRKALSSSMHRLIDGNGAVRIADELIRLLHSD